MDYRKLVAVCAQAALDKKARDLAVMDVGGLTTVADYLVICSGSSSTHLQAIADSILEKLSASDIEAWGTEGSGSGGWILLDYGGVVVHIFAEEVRLFYNLERLWGDAKKVAWG